MQNILHVYTGTEAGTPSVVPAGPSYLYSLAQINTLLARTSPGKEVAGVRLHFNQTAGLAPGPDELIAIGVSTDNPTEEIFTANSPDYILSDNKGNKTFNEVEGKLASSSNAKLSSNNAGAGFNPDHDACVYFSRTVLNQLIATGGNDISHIGFHLCDFVTAPGPDGSPVVYKSLIASARNAAGDQLGNAIRSDLPCPPHCGTDYPPED